MTPYYERDGIVLYHGDCLEVLASLGQVDAVITDPPYGMRWDTDSSRFVHRKRDGCGKSDWGPIVGDNEAFDPAPFLGFPRVILWGANHYAQRLPVGTTLVWIKRHDHLFGTWLSDCEIAWMKGGFGVYAFRRPFTPPSRMAEGGGRALHPTQKPLALMRWCMEKCRVPREGIILDPFAGSGTTLVAAQIEGRRAIGIEIEERWCELAARRLEHGSKGAVQVAAGQMPLWGMA